MSDDAPPVEIAGQCVWTDYLEAQRAHERRQRARLPGWRVLWALLAVLLVGYAAAGLFVHPRWWRQAALPAAVAAAILVRRRVWMPWAYRRLWDREPSMRVPFRSLVSADGIRTETPNGSSTTDWTPFVRWAETDTLFLMYHSEEQYGVVPKRLVAGEDGVARLRALLAARLGAPA